MKPWQEVWGTKSPRSWSTFSILYMKSRCDVIADVTKNAWLLEWNTSEIVHIFHTLLKIFWTIFSAQFCFTHITTMFMQFLSPSDIYRYEVQQHEVVKFQSGALEVFRSWRQRITGVWGTEVRPVGSRGKAPLGGLGTKSPRSCRYSLTYIWNSDIW